MTKQGVCKANRAFTWEPRRLSRVAMIYVATRISRAKLEYSTLPVDSPFTLSVRDTMMLGGCTENEQWYLDLLVPLFLRSITNMSMVQFPHVHWSNNLGWLSSHVCWSKYRWIAMFERFHCSKFPLHMVPNWVDSLFWHKTILGFSWFIGSIPTFIIFNGKRHLIFLTFFRLGIPFIVPIISPLHPHHISPVCLVVTPHGACYGAIFTGGRCIVCGRTRWELLVPP